MALLYGAKTVNDEKTTVNEIRALCAEKSAAVLAHFYQPLSVQRAADLVGDSYELARKSVMLEADTLVMCGVRFMAESVKLLNPDKRVLLPASDAGCPMADTIDEHDIAALRAAHPSAAVVCYVNTTAAVKAVSDICCTSANAIKVVRSLPNDEIIFVPDKNLGAFVAAAVPEKKFWFFEGGCPIHSRVGVRDVDAAKAAHPDALVLVHPECSPEVAAKADFVGSTSQILAYAAKTDADLIIGTEMEIALRIREDNPERGVWVLTNTFLCPNMKKTSLDLLLHSLKTGEEEITLGSDLIEAAKAPLKRMVEVG